MARLRGGVGAKGSAKARFFHPSANIRARWPNEHKSLRIHDVLITGKGMHRVNRKDQLCYECRINEIDDGTVFHIVTNNFKIETEGATPFPDEINAHVSTTTPTDPSEEAALRASTTNVTPNITRAEIDELRQQGIEVDDDNEPAPENAIPEPPATTQVGEWITPIICPRREQNVANRKGNWKNFAWSVIAEMDELAAFRMCFPEKWVTGVLIPATNKNLSGDPMDLHEFYVFLGCHFYMCCYDGITDRREWWSSKPITMFEGAPFRLNEYMSYKRFAAITAAMCYTDKPPPSFVDRFHDVRQMIDEFNKHYEEEYVPSWLNCLDESMNSWLDKFCPGFMNVPRKPNDIGNEFHSIADGDDGSPIMWRVKLQEGKDRPKLPDGKWAFPSKFEGVGPKGLKYTKTSTLMCEMTVPIHGTGKVVTMDSGFCIRDGIRSQHHLGVFGQALIKKRKYWPNGVPGDQIDKYFEDKPVGYCETLRQEFDGDVFYIHCCKDTKFVTKMMSTHGLLTPVEDHVTWRQKPSGEWFSFQYPEFLSRHNHAKHWVDDVNNRRHDPIGLEEVWHTKWWPTRQFTFLCSVAESNAVHSLARAKKSLPTPQIDFRRRLAKCMLYNRIGDDGVRRGSPLRVKKRSRASLVVEHGLVSRPPYTGNWSNSLNTWTRISTIYAKTKCATCKNRVRTYCQCNKRVCMCTTCFGNHMVAINSTI